MFAATRFTPTPKRLNRQKTTLSSISDSDKDPVHVYCRLRPLEGESPTHCMKLLSPQEIAVNWDVKGVQKEVHYKFKHIFTGFSTQEEVFNHVAYPLVEDLLRGKSGLLFTYGVTGSGKTYTLQGNQEYPGIMPRCIDTLFNSIDGCQTPKYVIKPDRMNGFEIQSEDDAIRERLAEARSTSRIPKTPKRPRQEKLVFNNEGSKVPVLNETHLYAVFITYVEIYNNSVYDLLDDTGDTIKLQSKILSQDSDRNMYVNGVVEVEVKSAQEAYDLLMAGQKRKRMAHTILNTESSRSHSIFNLRVVQLEKEPGDVIPEKNLIQISQLSLVDLAGSERTNRTQTTGVRLKEASSINNSLMTLRLCLDTLRENQRSKAGKIVPYRDSRLTLLFKNYFEGEGVVNMMVCVNPTWEDLDENLHVMRFAEVSQEVRIIRAEPKYTPATVKKTIARKRAPLTPSVWAALGNIPVFKFSQDIDCGIVLDKLSEFLQQFVERTATHTKEIDETQKSFRKRVLQIDQQLAQQKSENSSLKHLNEKQLKKIENQEAKLSDLQSTNNSLSSKNNELQVALRSLHNQLKEKDLKINQDRIKQVCIKQKLKMDQEQMTQELETKLKRQRDHLQSAMEAKLKKAKEALDGDIALGDVPKSASCDENIAPTPAPPPTPKRRMVNNIHTNTPRYRRRSKSAGERWLEHNTIKPVPLGTVMQPTMDKHKSVTKLTKASDVTNPKQNRYCLLAQEPQDDGELETKLYKGDILQTVSGGAQVILNDVEKLRQDSPTK